VALAGLWFAPYVYFEITVLRTGSKPSPLISPPAISGRWFDDYFVIEQIGPATYAIGEPRYYQGNYSYLLLGKERALLFDAGTGLRDIVPVVRSLTALPVTVLPSHLHFDHVGALGKFERTALPDLPALRQRAKGRVLTLRRYEFLGALDRLSPPTFPVDDWWSDGQFIDLGGRTIQVLRLPGHTADSVMIWDSSSALGFVGDFIYPGELYAFLPGASLRDYRISALRLLSFMPDNARLYSAHMQDPPAVPAAPVLHRHEVVALARFLEARDAGQMSAVGFYPRVYPVIGPITLGTGFQWNLR
jgi:glyoxylase-like metal-dependent hydrolase (beta-lactamase superfamily II)